MGILSDELSANLEDWKRKNAIKKFKKGTIQGKDGRVFGQNLAAQLRFLKTSTIFRNDAVFYRRDQTSVQNLPPK